MFFMAHTIVLTAGRAGVADLRFSSVLEDLKNNTKNEKHAHGDYDDDKQIFHVGPFISDRLMPNRYP